MERLTAGARDGPRRQLVQRATLTSTLAQLIFGGLACLLSLAAPSLIATPNLPLNRALHTHPELILDTLLLPNPTLKLTPVVVDEPPR
ncbi:hypothetical protein [Mycobacterium tuberculosis]|nr:hypothetical protein [Mycobacterium tuberculosis]